MTHILRVYANSRVFSPLPGSTHVEGMSLWSDLWQELVSEQAREKSWWAFLPGPDTSMKNLERVLEKHDKSLPC